MFVFVNFYLWLLSFSFEYSYLLNFILLLKEEQIKFKNLRW